MHGEVIQIHVGHAGTQIGSALWELHAQEHDLDLNGLPNNTTNNSNRNIFYQQSCSGKYFPRALFVDTDPDTINGIKNSNLSSCFNTNYLINSNQDASNNFSRGRCTVGKNISHKIIESTRKLVESCDQFQGFIIHRSLGGGTGSGLGSNILENLSQEFAKKAQFDFAIQPSPSLSTSVLEPYNALLSIDTSIEFTDCTFLLENQPLYNICQKNLQISQPNYNDLNNLISQALSTFTTSMRFKSTLNVDFSDYQTNLVPYPRIHYPIISYSPIISKSNILHNHFNPNEITMQCFNPENQTILCNPENAYYMAIVLLYQGDITVSECNSAIQHIKYKSIVNFVNWCPTGFKLGINKRIPSVSSSSKFVSPPKSCTMISNTSAISRTWSNLNKKFDLMFSKRAFVHWYVGEGMEEGEFTEARENLALLENDYKEVIHNDVYDEHAEY